MNISNFIKKQSKMIAIIAGAVALGGITSATVLASIPDSSGAIHGCYGKTAGNLRVIDSPSKQCTVLENPISWPSNSASASVGPKVTSGRFDTTTSDNTDHVLFTLPGFGQIEVNCFKSFNNGQAFVFRNTSGVTIQYIDPSGVHDIAPGATVNDVVGTGTILTKGSGSALTSSQITGINSSVIEDDVQACKFDGQGLVQ